MRDLRESRTEEQLELDRQQACEGMQDYRESRSEEQVELDRRKACEGMQDHRQHMTDDEREREKEINRLSHAEHRENMTVEDREREKEINRLSKKLSDLQSSYAYFAPLRGGARRRPPRSRDPRDLRAAIDAHFMPIEEVRARVQEGVPAAPPEESVNDIIARVLHTLPNGINEGVCAVCDELVLVQDLNYYRFNDITGHLLRNMQARLTPPDDPLVDDNNESRGPIPADLLAFCFSLKWASE
jgi:hypothetical protein